MTKFLIFLLYSIIFYNFNELNFNLRKSATNIDWNGQKSISTTFSRVRLGWPEIINYELDSWLHKIPQCHSNLLIVLQLVSRIQSILIFCLGTTLWNPPSRPIPKHMKVMVLPSKWRQSSISEGMMLRELNLFISENSDLVKHIRVPLYAVIKKGMASQLLQLLQGFSILGFVALVDCGFCGLWL